MIKVKSSGSFSNFEKFANRMLGRQYLNHLDDLGRQGVEALAAATPVRTGQTANSWEYELVQEAGQTVIYWNNTHINQDVNIAVIIQYGHGTGTGGYVEGIDYINPALKPVFQDIADRAWKVVTE